MYATDMNRALKLEVKNAFKLYQEFIIRQFFVCLFFITFSVAFGQSNVSVRKLDNTTFNSTNEGVKISSGDLSLWKNEPFGQRDSSKELTDRRNENSKHFDLGNGSTVAHIASGPIHYSENGTWKTIFHTISKGIDGFENIHNSHKTFYPKTATGNISTTLKNGAILKDMLNMRRYFEVNGEKVQIQNIQNSTGSVDFNQLTYQNVYGNGIDLRLTQNTSLRKMDYLIQHREAIGNIPSGADFLVFEEQVELPHGWNVELKNNVIYLIDQDGKSQVNYEKPTFIDAPTRKSTKGEFQTPSSQHQRSFTPKEGVYAISINGTRLTIKTYVEISWLMDEDRIFPLEIDPTMNVTPDNTVNWTRCVNSGGVNNTGSYYGVSGCTFYFSSIKFNLSALSIPNTLITVTSAVGNHCVNSSSGAVSGRSFCWSNSSDPTVGGGISLYNSMTTMYSAGATIPNTIVGWIATGLTTNGIAEVSSNLGGYLNCGIVPIGTWNCNEEWIGYYGYNDVQRPFIAITYTTCTIPTSFALTGAGTCLSGSTPIGLNGSQLGISYQLKKNGVNQGGLVAGNGSAISFGDQNDGTYTVEASGVGFCTTLLSGSAVLVKNPVITSGAGALICPNATIDLTASGEWVALPTGGTRNAVTGSTTNEYYHIFQTTGSSSFVNASGQSFNNARLLVIAGGGGGGGGRGGGGGAGGLIHQTSAVIPTGTTNLVVGAGGNGGAVGAQGNDGSNSTITSLSITAVGGGGGGTHNSGSTGLNNGRNGGSGGGAGMNYQLLNWIAGTPTAGQGYAGQRSGNNTDSPRNTGGGGGAGGAGVSGTGGNVTWSTGTKPNGGIGVSNNITGVNVWYAGGGGGSRAGSDAQGAGAGTGGSSVGGNGQYPTAATAGLANTGSGGGGSEATGGNGGSGVVIIRYRAPKWSITGGTATSGATINALTGVLTAGTSVGTIDINYTNEFGCVATTTVTVVGIPSATLTTSPTAICHGNSVNLGGNVANSTGTWTINFTNGATATGTANGAWTSSFTPTATTIYSISSISASGCVGTGTGSTTITLPTKSGALGSAGESVTCPVSGTNWVDFYHPVSGNYLGSVNGNNALSNLGNVTISANVGVSNSTYACNDLVNEAYRTAYMGRNWVFNSSAYSGTAFSNAALIRLPYYDAELLDMNTHASSVTLGNSQDDNATHASIMLTKFSGAIEDNNPFNNCSGGTTRSVNQTLNALLSPAIPNANYVQFPVTEFSEMYLNKQTIFGPLPVTLTQFAATCDQAVTLNWRTASEQNSDRFVVESSEDLTYWETVAEIQAAGNSSTIIDYSTSDNNRRSGISYYRLVQLDLDGKQEIFGPISVSCDVISNDFKVYPNPSNGKFTVELLSNQSEENVIITLSDVTGKIIETRKVHVLEGSNQFLFDGNVGVLGTYIVRINSIHQKINPVKLVMER